MDKQGAIHGYFLCFTFSASFGKNGPVFVWQEIFYK